MDSLISKVKSIVPGQSNSVAGTTKKEVQKQENSLAIFELAKRGGVLAEAKLRNNSLTATQTEEYINILGTFRERGKKPNKDSCRLIALIDLILLAANNYCLDPRRWEAIRKAAGIPSSQSLYEATQRLFGTVLKHSESRILKSGIEVVRSGLARAKSLTGVMPDFLQLIIWHYLQELKDLVSSNPHLNLIADGLTNLSSTSPEIELHPTMPELFKSAFNKKKKVSARKAVEFWATEAYLYPDFSTHMDSDENQKKAFLNGDWEIDPNLFKKPMEFGEGVTKIYALLSLIECGNAWAAYKANLDIAAHSGCNIPAPPLVIETAIMMAKSHIQKEENAWSVQAWEVVVKVAMTASVYRCIKNISKLCYDPAKGTSVSETREEVRMIAADMLQCRRTEQQSLPALPQVKRQAPTKPLRKALKKVQLDSNTEEFDSDEDIMSDRFLGKKCRMNPSKVLDMQLSKYRDSVADC